MWARVVNGQVIMVVERLPSQFQNVTSFDALSNAELIPYGWFPFSQTIPTFDKTTQYLKSSGYTITATDVTEVFDVYTKTVNTTLPSKALVSKLDFRSLFTTNELIGIEVAKLTATDVTVKAALSVLSDNMNVADQIDLSDERTIMGVQALVSFGLLTQERATQILTIS